MTSIANTLDVHSHQVHGLTPPVVSPRTEESLQDLQRRRDQAFSARNRAVSIETLIARELHVATLSGNAAEMLRVKSELQKATARRESATADYVAVLAEIHELIAAELAEVAA